MRKPEEYIAELTRYPSKPIAHFKDISNEPADDFAGGKRLTIFTEKHSYGIALFPPAPHRENGYMGCIASCRAPYPGEDWTRGNDLPDGPYSDETWHSILAGIIAYELLPIVSKVEGRPDGQVALKEKP